MRITRIAAQNFLSYETLDIPNLDPQLNVVVGPNGSGKSNLVRLLSVVRDTAGWPSNSTLGREDLIQLRRLGTTTGFYLAVDLELTEDRERSLLVDFLRGAFLSAELPPSYGAGFPGEWREWAQKALQDAPSFLFQGTLRVGLPDISVAGPDVTYQCEVKGVPLVWSATEGLGRSQASLSRVSPPEAFGRSKGAAREGLGGLFSRGDRIALEIRPNRLREYPEIIESLSDLTGEELDLSGSRFYTGAWVFHHLFRQGLYLTDNIRVPPRLTWSAIDLARSPQSLSLTDGSELPLYLFRLRTGEAQERQTFQEVCRHFSSLTDQSLEITLRPRAGSARDASLAARGIGLREPASGPPREEAQEEFELVPVVQSSRGDVPIDLAGAGAWEAAILSAFLAIPGGVLVLDEPALNLHPVRQRRLLGMVRSRASQVFLVTHSPYMVPADEQADLGRITRFGLERGATKVYRIQPGSSAAREQTKWLRWFSELAEVRALLFAHAVILVEGPTELGALPTWFAKSSTARERGTPDDLNLIVLNVGGDRNYQGFVGLSAAFGIQWAIVCDAKALGSVQDGRYEKGPVFTQLDQAGVRMNMGSISAAGDFADLKRWAAVHGVFTLAEDFGQEIEAFLERRFPLEYAAAHEAWPRSKALAGRAVAGETDCPEEMDVLYSNILDWFDTPPAGSAAAGDEAQGSEATP